MCHDVQAVKTQGAAVDLNLSMVTRPVGRLIATAQNGLEVLRLGGLETGTVASPSQIVESVRMYKLRRYFPPDSRPGQPPVGPPVLMVHPMMMSADMWDVTRDEGAVGILHAHGLDPWVIDFGEPDKVEGGMRRTLTDHIVALSQAIDTVKDVTGADIHLVGYSQGGMWCYQVAAYRRSKSLASIVTFGSPVDTLAALPMGIPANFAAPAANFMADHVFSRLAIPSWMARTGFQMLDPLKTAKARVDFLRQLHDREALLPREQQRRFLEREGWIAWSGPAISELLKQFIAHNRMMTGGFAVNGQMVTLTDITCPVLAFVGEVDDIGQPASVRGIRRAAPDAEVYECTIRTGHFGLVVGSKAAQHSWPTVAAWVKWLSTGGDKPTGIDPMADQPAEHTDSGVALSSRIAHELGEASEAAIGLVRGAANAVVTANKSVRTLAVETARTLPRLVRLGQINDHTRISLGRIIEEQAHDAPQGEFLLFDGRVHTYEAVNRRINNVVRGLIEVGVRQGDRVGVLMETRPSALVAIAALSRLGAIAVVMRPDADLAASVRLGGATEILTDPTNLESVLASDRQLLRQVLVLGGGEARDLHLPEDSAEQPYVIDMEKIDPDAVELPGWYRPNPGLARDLAFIAFSAAGGELVAKQITNYRWAVSAFGTASTAALDRRDTVYCLTPLHHESALLVSLGGAVVGGTRIALSRGLDRDRFVQEVRQYGVTVVSYTWAMLREIVDDPAFVLHGNHPVRLFIGSGMPTGLWGRVVEAFAPAHVVEFFATTDGQAVLANVSGAKVGSKGRPLPGAGRIELGAYDTEHDLILENDRGFVQIAEPHQVGVLLAASNGPIDPSASVKRGVFAAGDTWISTEYLFYRDDDGDYWLAGRRGSVVHTPRGVVYAEPVTDALGCINGVDLAVTYNVPVGGHEVAVSAVTLLPGASITAADLTEACAKIPIGLGPDIVCVVPEMNLSATYRPTVSALRAAGIPKAGRQVWYFDAESGQYRRLTPAARAELSGGRS
ncbi:alpha/beta fold hydrolase [Mycobacterium avium subsp. paratuberculosis]|uniref:acyl-CoA synthetase n=1 Tax=Mycobacterium avium TaxID=1764 RepID=UPI000A2F45FB|nr:acyl-CoA synthetase [Mycobacterium avium]AZP81017.1 acyl-CoA synthetase [Mycobacterium avium subsp. paratuberculosis]QPM71395.1 alpha/beta fold hydrolase [Mycobacterium avium subsp. paratuberculosis S397]QQK50563.1 alpha/beta fold hydrolase [Mycobacterium avium subsp. paratuberculosis]WPS77993.1 acyl-CoA synthetase [Mycobacterium avium subsp. paratuberculosis]